MGGKAGDAGSPGFGTQLATGLANAAQNYSQASQQGGDTGANMLNLGLGSLANGVSDWKQQQNQPVEVSPAGSGWNLLSPGAIAAQTGQNVNAPAPALAVPGASTSLPPALFTPSNQPPSLAAPQKLAPANVAPPTLFGA